MSWIDPSVIAISVFNFCVGLLCGRAGTKHGKALSNLNSICHGAAKKVEKTKNKKKQNRRTAFPQKYKVSPKPEIN